MAQKKVYLLAWRLFANTEGFFSPFLFCRWGCIWVPMGSQTAIWLRMGWKSKVTIVHELNLKAKSCKFSLIKFFLGYIIPETLPLFPIPIHTVLENVSSVQNEEVNCRTFFHIKNASDDNRCKGATIFFSSVTRRMHWWGTFDATCLLTMYKKSHVSFVFVKLIQRQN